MCNIEAKISSVNVLILGVILIGITNSCTDLTESVQSTVEEENYFQTEEQIISSLGAAYNPLAGNYGATGTRGFIWMMNLNTTDQIVVPTTADGGWEDGGIFIRMHRHRYGPDEQSVNVGWTDLFSGVNNTNRLIFKLRSLSESGNISQEKNASFISEMRAMRAFYYYLLLDNFGNVPIVKSFKEATENPSQPSKDFQEGRQAVFDFVESELLDVIDKLSADPDETYGRMNKWGAHMILARLYLNAEVYTGTPHWEEAATHASAVINSGKVSMAPNYEDIFLPDNSDSPEAIFAIPYDEVFYHGFDYITSALHYTFQSKFNLRTRLYDGERVMEDFYMSYIDSSRNPGPQGTVIGRYGSDTTGTVDERMLNNFYVGPQFDFQGNPLIASAVLLPELDTGGNPVNHRPHLYSLTNATLDGGARTRKWKLEIGATNNLNNDFFIFRYTEALLIKAEALWRLNSNSSDALKLVNRVRQRAGVYGFSNLTADKLLAEWGREMFYEDIRRTNLIRFKGKKGGATRYNDPWWEKDVTEEYKNVFPIPENQLESNTNLVQNPGY